MLKSSSKQKLSQKDIEAAIQELTINHYLTGATNIGMMNKSDQELTSDTSKPTSYKKRELKQKLKQEEKDKIQ